MIEAKDMLVVIPSRRRVESCAQTVKLFKNPVVCVAEEELGDYKDIGAKIVPHPNDIFGLGRLRQWILDHFNERVIVQCNDDVRSLYCVVGFRPRRIVDPHAIERILLNSANICEELGISCFSFNPFQDDVRKFRPHKPFQLTRLEGALLGILDRKIRYDPEVTQFDDVDLSLQALLKERIVWQDSRFAAEHNFITKAGGNTVSRSVENTQREFKHLKQKWGQYIGIGYQKRVVSLKVRVSRQQDLEL
ncbi:MAG TPA: hypothetical protein VNL14_16570 [Candidatus Acidoferrales bacterium]|nr:hypothetical protein [Candidatus Acidoferrales bacterium]